MTISVYKVQQRLTELGYSPGPVDGVRGKRTIAAVKSFQKAVGLFPDGIVGPATKKKLFEGARRSMVPPGIPDAMPWFIEAERLRGVREIAGKKNNPTIMGWARGLKLWYPDDETPWCGLFVAHCIGSQLPDEPLPNNPPERPQLAEIRQLLRGRTGAVVVFWRGKLDGWQGHVGFVVGTEGKDVYCLGGNQGNEVNIRKFPHDRVLGYRWPISALRQGVTVPMTGGVYSDSEQ